MLATRESLLAIVAADLMSRDIVLVPKEMSMRGAARLLDRAKVSGAPVLDDDGRCIGVISATDFLRYTEKDHTESGQHPNVGCPAVHSWHIFEAETPYEDRVADVMTADPVTAKRCTNICELARMMMDAHIHRVIVVDESDRAVGIVSSTDILAAVAHAGEPM